MASALEILNAAQLQFERNPPKLIVAQSVLQAIPNTTTTAITWPTPSVDTYGAYSAGTPTRATPKVAGTYLVVATIAYAANATGGRNATIFKNGATTIATASAGNATATWNSDIQVTFPVAFNGSTDYIEINANQNSGGSLNTVITITNLSLFYLSA